MDISLRCAIHCAGLDSGAHIATAERALLIDAFGRRRPREPNVRGAPEKRRGE